jgi:hypothetical protein
MHTIGVGSRKVKRRGGVGDCIDTFDRLVERTVLGDIFNNYELKPIAMSAK